MVVYDEDAIDEDELYKDVERERARFRRAPKNGMRSWLLFLPLWFAMLSNSII